MSAKTNQSNYTRSKTHGTDAERSNAGAAITQAIREADLRVRQQFPALRHQTAIGMGFVLLGFGTAATSAWLYLTGLLSIWACIPINAIAFAVLREIEHDLIHNLYFTGKRALQNLVLFVIWPALGNVPSPLYRRKMHLQHHRSSGRIDDIEERLIGNGTGFGPLRWLAMLDTGLSMIFRRRELEQIPGFRHSELFKHLVPVVAIYYVLWFSFLIFHGITLGLPLFGLAVEMPGWLESVHPWLDAVAVVWVLPNVIRQACLQVLSSTMHYYGDVEGTVQQTQVLSKWYWQPLQWISINFGKSHAIHHFVVNQPFYLREMVRRDAHAAMRKHGVRFDDLGTFTRANRWGDIDQSQSNELSSSTLSENSSTRNETHETARRGRIGQVAEVAANLQGEIVFLKLEGRVDAISAEEFEKNLLTSIKGGAKRLAIDFSRVDHISDTALRVLLRTAKRLMHSDGKMVLHSLNDQLKQVFQLTGFSMIFPIHRSQDDAVSELSRIGYITLF